MEIPHVSRPHFIIRLDRMLFGFIRTCCLDTVGDGEQPPSTRRVQFSDALLAEQSDCFLTARTGARVWHRNEVVRIIGREGVARATGLETGELGYSTRIPMGQFYQSVACGHLEQDQSHGNPDVNRQV